MILCADRRDGVCCVQVSYRSGSRFCSYRGFCGFPQMKRFFWGLVVVLALCVSGLFVFSLKYGELDGVRLDSMKARLAFPDAIRTVPLEMACSTAELSRSWIECGGVCGTEYSIAFRSTGDAESLTERLTAHVGLALSGHKSSVSANPQSTSDECRPVTLRIWQDSRDVQ